MARACSGYVICVVCEPLQCILHFRHHRGVYLLLEPARLLVILGLDRGVVVGERTYGKGLIQSVFENFDGSALVITVGKYVTPAGKDIDRLGIVPDFNYMPSLERASAKVDACPLQRL